MTVSESSRMLNTYLKRRSPSWRKTRRGWCLRWWQRKTRWSSADQITRRLFWMWSNTKACTRSTSGFSTGSTSWWSYFTLPSRNYMKSEAECSNCLAFSKWWLSRSFCSWNISKNKSTVWSNLKFKKRLISSGCLRWKWCGQPIKMLRRLVVAGPRVWVTNIWALLKDCCLHLLQTAISFLSLAHCARDNRPCSTAIYSKTTRRASFEKCHLFASCHWKLCSAVLPQTCPCWLSSWTGVLWRTPGCCLNTWITWRCKRCR